MSFESKQSMKDYSKIIALAKKTEETLLMKDKQIFELKQNHLNLKKSLFSMRNKAIYLSNSNSRNNANIEEKKSRSPRHHLAKSAIDSSYLNNENKFLKAPDSKNILCKLQSREISEEDENEKEKENLLIEELKKIYVEERSYLLLY